MIGIDYLIVSAYVFFDDSKSLFEEHHTQPFVVEIIFLIVTVIVLPSMSGALKE